MQQFRNYLKGRFTVGVALVYQAIFLDILPALARGSSNAMRTVRV